MSSELPTVALVLITVHVVRNTDAIPDWPPVSCTNCRDFTMPWKMISEYLMWGRDTSLQTLPFWSHIDKNHWNCPGEKNKSLNRIGSNQDQHDLSPSFWQSFYLFIAYFLFNTLSHILSCLIYFNLSYLFLPFPHIIIILPWQTLSMILRAKESLWLKYTLFTSVLQKNWSNYHLLGLTSSHLQ